MKVYSRDYPTDLVQPQTTIHGSYLWQLPTQDEANKVLSWLASERIGYRAELTDDGYVEVIA